MNYVNIVNIIFWTILIIMTLMAIHFIFFAVVGIFTKKTFPETDTKLKYGIIIPARNEEAVVGNLIDSIKKNNYPQDKLHIFLIAHNCTDKTAEIGREKGVTVYEYNNPSECTMGYAFRYLFRQIEKDYGTQNYDGFFLFNADNICDENYFTKMNDAFVSENKQSVITSFRNSKNFGSNLISACYGLYFMYGCRFESRGRTALGCSTRVQGTGYVINSKVVKNGWPYVTLTEDWEFTSDQILQDTKIQFCDDAVFYDEQPTSMKVMWTQRLRWSRGHLLVFLSRMKDLLKGLFTPKKKGGTAHKVSTYDIMINILPVCAISTAVFVLHYIFLALCPLFGDYNLGNVLWTHTKGVLFFSCISYGIVVFSSILLFFLERKRIKGVKLSIKIASALFWPLFLFISTPSEIVALFKRKLGWAPIPHKDTTDFEQLHDTKGENEDSNTKIANERSTVA